jgi:hypothetical protein
VFTVMPHRLSLAATEQLNALLDRKSADIAALRKVEAALGLAIDGAKHLDHTPRPADYVAEFERVRRDAFELFERLGEWTEYFCDAAQLHGCDIDDVLRTLASLVDAGTAVMKEHSGRSSRGAPKKTALMEAIRQLRCIFRDYYGGLREGRKRRGAFVFAAEQERREFEFVNAALLDVNVVCGENELRRALRDPRTQPSAASPVQRLP